MPRAERRRRRRLGVIQQVPWRRLQTPYAPLEALDAEGLEAIHQTSMRILEEIGMDFLHPEALEILRAGGAEVEPGSSRVRFDRHLVELAVTQAPAEFTLHARNPERSVVFGGRHVNFAMVASAPSASDLERGRRDGNFEDYCNFVRLGQALNVLHLFGGYPVEPVDLPPETRHLDCLHAFVTLADKPFHGYSLGRTRILDAIEMARIARGVDRGRLMQEPSLVSIVNSSSPLRLDGPMIEGIIELARAHQIVAITPFTLAGAMSPATLAGALAQQNAEALACLTLAQLVNPGAPVVYGGFTSNVDMRSGSPAFGTPEYARAAVAGGQLARRYRLPYRSSNANAANTVDAQAAYESQVSLWSAVLGHANLVMHAAGWLESGLCASFEKVIIDAECLQCMAEFLQPLPVDEDTLAFEAIREVGPGGHFFGATHTLARYESAFCSPIVSDWRNYEAWREAGAPDAATHAHRIYKQLLAEFEPPSLDEAVREELAEFVARRKREGGAVAA